MSHEFESDISLKEVILRLQEYLLMLLKSWKMISFISLLMGLLYVGLKFNEPNRYNAGLTFMLNEDERGGLSGLSGILGQFGLGAGTTESNFDKIIELSRTRRITENAIFQTINHLGKDDLLANHIIINLEENKTWYKGSGLLGEEDSLSLEGFRFENDNVSSFNNIQNKALKKIHTHIVGGENSQGALIPYYNEITGIMSLDIESTDEDLSIILVNKLFESLSQFYIDKATEKQKYDYDIVKEKYDSINNVLSSIQYQLALFEDSNQALYRKKDILRKSQLNAEKQKLQYMSGKAEEQLQLAQLSLDNKTPYIQVIDYPLKPLKPLNRSILFYFIVGCILGGTVISLYLITKKIYRSIMQ